MKLYTIGSAGTSAEAFFGKLSSTGVRRLLDTRLRRDGQLSAFAKVPDLPYFLERLTDCVYESTEILAPTSELLKSYRRSLCTWDEYAASYLCLLEERKPECALGSAVIDACLLCSEHSPSRCHRRLAGEYLQRAFAEQFTIELVHL